MKKSPESGHRVLAMKIIVFTLLLCAITSGYAQEVDTGRNRIGFLYGTNFFGNSISLDYGLNLSDHWMFGFTYGRGYVHFTTRDRGDISIFHNVPGDENNISLELKQTFDLVLHYRRISEKRIVFLNSLGVGLTHAFVTLNSAFTRSESEGVYKAEDDYSVYGPIIQVGVLEVNPEGTGSFSYSLGFRSKIGILESPLVLYYDNNLGDVERWPFDESHGKKHYIHYPEIYFKVAYRL
jgi:hypothetical protein